MCHIVPAFETISSLEATNGLIPSIERDINGTIVSNIYVQSHLTMPISLINEDSRIEIISDYIKGLTTAKNEKVDSLHVPAIKFIIFTLKSPSTT